MAIELSHLMQVILGQRPVLTVGDLPRPVATYLKAHPAIVFLRHSELKHILSDHTYIAPFDVMNLTFAIEKGAYFEDPKRKNAVTCIYRNADNDRYYTVGIKTASNGSETWIATYHRAKDRFVRSREGKWKLICGPKK
jgi:hypothetical protein